MSGYTPEERRRMVENKKRLNPAEPAEPRDALNPAVLNCAACRSKKPS